MPRNSKLLIVAKDLDALLSIPGTTTKSPKSFLLTHDQRNVQNVAYYLDSGMPDDTPSCIQNYFKALRFWDAMKEFSQHEDQTGSILYFGIRKVEIRPIFGTSDLDRSIEIEAIECFLKNEDRIETRKDIFQSALTEFLEHQNPDSSFAYLLRESERFARRLREGLALFLSRYSPQKLEEEGRALHSEIAEKVEKSIQAIEIKSLSIPFSLILVVKEAEKGQGFSSANSTLLAAVVLYALVMIAAHYSHLSNASLIKKRIDQSTFDLKEQGLEASNPLLSKSFATLSRRNFAGTIVSWALCIFALAPVFALLLAILCGT